MFHITVKKNQIQSTTHQLMRLCVWVQQCCGVPASRVRVLRISQVDTANSSRWCTYIYNQLIFPLYERHAAAITGYVIWTQLQKQDTVSLGIRPHASYIILFLVAVPPPAAGSLSRSYQLRQLPLHSPFLQPLFIHCPHLISFALYNNKPTQRPAAVVIFYTLLLIL